MAKYIITKILEDGSSATMNYENFEKLNETFIVDELSNNKALPEITFDQKQEVIKEHMEKFGFFVGLLDEEWRSIASSFLEKHNLKTNDSNVRLLFDTCSEAFHESVKNWLPDLLEEYYVNNLDEEEFDREYLCPYCNHLFEDYGIKRTVITDLKVDENGRYTEDYWSDETEYVCGYCGGEIDLEECGLNER